MSARSAVEAARVGVRTGVGDSGEAGEVGSADGDWVDGLLRGGAVERSLASGVWVYSVHGGIVILFSLHKILTNCIRRACGQCPTTLSLPSL